MTLISNDSVQAPAFIGAVAAPHVFVTDEQPADFGAREDLLDAAFGAARFDKTVERLRKGRLPAPGLALVAKDAGELVGTLRLWQIRAGDVPALLLGPLAVDKAYRSRGLGRRLRGKLCSVPWPLGMAPSCSLAMRLIMSLSVLPGAIRLGFPFPGLSMKRVFLGSNSMMAL